MGKAGHELSMNIGYGHRGLIIPITRPEHTWHCMMNMSIIHPLLPRHVSPAPHCMLVNDILFAICSFSGDCSVPMHPGADPAALVAMSRLPVMRGWQVGFHLTLNEF